MLQVPLVGQSIHYFNLKKYDVAQEKILTEKTKVYTTDLKYSLGAIYEQLAEGV